jgi:hypothetical protein
MSRGSWRVKPTEIARTVKSVQSTGLNVRNIEIDRDGLIRVNVGKPDLAVKPGIDETSADIRKLL